VIPQTLIPIFYSVAMAVSAVTALVFGKLFDKKGISVVLLAVFLSAFFAPFILLGTFWVILIGMVLWGIGFGAQESMLKAVITEVIAVQKRSTGFGVFDTVFGVAWFIGSAAMGFLYDRSLVALIGLSIILQLAALPVFLIAHQKIRK